MWTLLPILGCLERVTGEARPLPEAFTKQGSDEASSGPEHLDMTHGSGDPSKGPFSGVEGERVAVSGTLVSDHDLPVDVDVLAPDP